MKHNRYRVLFIVLLALCAGRRVSGQGLVSDEVERAALMALYNSLDGANWVSPWPLTCIASYPQPDSVRKLVGISMSGGDITSLDLQQRRMTGTLPTELNTLTALQYLYLGNYSTIQTTTINAISGAMPDLSALSKLVYLSINDHRMSGTFPPWISRLTTLRSLDLSAYGGGPGFDGPIPSSIWKITALSSLVAANNNFNNANDVPDSLAALDQLVSLSLSNCKLGPASVTDGLTGLLSLQSLDMSYNPGFVENELLPNRLLDLPALRTLYLRGNGFRNFPSSFRDLTVLSYLDLGYTPAYASTGFLSDVIDTLKVCPSIQTLALTYSSIQGLPSDFDELTIDILYLSANPLQPEQCNILGDMPELHALYMLQCGLSDLPSNLSTSTTLNTLDVSENSLDPVPAVIKDIPNLTSLSINYNGIDALPAWFGTGYMDTLRALYINYNSLITFPDNFARLKNLNILSANNNILDGTWPADFDDLTMLTYLSMNNNRIDSLPDLSGMTLLNTVLVNHNLLSGTVPLFLTDQTSRKQYIDISYNTYSMVDTTSYFAGSSPTVNVSNNQFTFEDVLEFKPNSPLNYIYSPQPLVDVEKNVYSYPGASIKFLALVDTAVAGTQYHWYRYGGGQLSGQGNYRFVHPGVVASDGGRLYYYTITHPDAPNLVLTSRRQTLVLTCRGLLTGVGFTAQRYLCAMNFKPSVGYEADCHTVTYQWNFGDGVTSVERSPWHAYETEGTYTVSLHIGYQCGTCTSDTTLIKPVNFALPDAFIQDSLINVATELREQVITVSAASFSDSWPLEQNSDAAELYSYYSGAQGVWRNEGTHVYDVPRLKSAVSNIAKDGTFTLEQFNWAYADVGAIPHWIRTNSMTHYSPYSYELENRDVLGIYSAAVYDYGGHLPSANGVNMRNNEMGFTGFEYMKRKATGNFLFGNDAIPDYYIYTVNYANNHIAIVEASVEQLENVTKVDVSGRSLLGGVFYVSRRSGVIQDDEVICIEKHPTNPNWSLIVLRRALFQGIWKGQIKVKNDLVPIVTPVVDSTFAHTGRKSLKIVTETTFGQDLLRLDSGKVYFLNAWVSVGNLHLATPNMGPVGVNAQFTYRNGTPLTTVELKPQGPVINGWQQVRGSFRCPDHSTKLALVFKTGSTPTWYDDIRLHPEKGNMKSYVYDLRDYRLRATLDEENFATLYFYDAEGNLYLIKKETAHGIKTLSENVSYQVEQTLTNK